MREKNELKNKQLIIFLGGIPGSGKTTLANSLATTLNIDKVISLDIIKKVILRYESTPYIKTTTHEAWKIENLDVVEGFKKHSKKIGEFFKEIIDEFKDERAIIVEGATIDKDFVDSFKNSNNIYINLYLDDKEKLIKRYESKAKNRKGKWIENIDSILKINEYLIKNSNINIKSSSKKETLKNVRRYIDESICL